MEAALAMILILTFINTVMNLAILYTPEKIMINDTAINEIQKAIEEIRQNGEHHAEFVRSNGELVIAGLEMALDILNSAEPKPCDDTISRQAAIETLKNHLSDTDVPKSYPGIIGALKEWLDCLPSAQPEPLSDAYKKAVWTWLLDYQIKVAELEGRYTPYEVLSWVANDWRKEHE